MGRTQRVTVAVLIAVVGCVWFKGVLCFEPSRDDHHTDVATTRDPRHTDEPSKPSDTPSGKGSNEPPTPVNHSAPRERIRRKSAPLQVESTTWGYVPLVVIAVFSVFMIMGRKFAALDNISLRLYLIRYISIETLYKTLAGASHHEYIEQRDVEIGHQVFVVFGVIFLTISFVLNDVNGNEQRYSFYVLQLTQMGLLLFNVFFDAIMIRRGYLRSVRSLNTKLRFAHCTYQVFLFCTDVLSSGVTALPVDCYIWATIHYSYESVGLLLEGLNVIGMSDIAIITLVNARAMSNSIDATGAVCAFGMTCLILSCVSIVGGIIWKAIDANKHPAFSADHDDTESGHDESKYSTVTNGPSSTDTEMHPPSTPSH